MTDKEMYRYKNWIFLKEETEDGVCYYSMEESDTTGYWQACTQYDFLQAKYYGKQYQHRNHLVKQKESIK